MATDEQERRLMKRIQTEMSLALAAAEAGMGDEMARKYRRTVSTLA